MTFSTEIDVRRAIRDRLAADPALIASLGGPRIYDEAPRNQAAPYVVFTRSEARDWSTMTEKGAEYLLTLEAWSQKPGAREALEIAGRIADLLHEAPLSPPGAASVHARIVAIDTQRQDANRFVRARLRLRVLIELES